jgi:hypothetical protein
MAGVRRDLVFFPVSLCSAAPINWRKRSKKVSATRFYTFSEGDSCFSSGEIAFFTGEIAIFTVASVLSDSKS